MHSDVRAHTQPCDSLSLSYRSAALGCRVAPESGARAGSAGMRECVEAKLYCRARSAATVNAPGPSIPLEHSESKRGIDPVEQEPIDNMYLTMRKDCL